jgi:hypothetical protein
MKHFLIVLALSLFASGAALAQDKKADAKKADPGDKKAAQQQRMKDCNAQAGKKDMKGDERKKFMSSCLKGETAAQPERTAQQSRMASCNKEAGSKNLKGEDRKKFMSSCLKN